MGISVDILSDKLKDINPSAFFFLGIGGIGMSALARFVCSRGFAVAGYDLTESAITDSLEQEGIDVVYDEGVECLQAQFLDSKQTVVVYTPAVPPQQEQYRYFREHGFCILKRSELLGYITRTMRTLAVAGTHGKTTTSTMLAHLMYQSEVGCNAFLGGISNNYETNLLLSADSNYAVAEADEYDRSFHRLTPFMAVITSVEADHLDIYGDEAHYREAFEVFASLIEQGGALIMKKGLPIHPKLAENVRLYTYSAKEKADFYADNIVMADGKILFDFHTPNSTIGEVKLGVPVPYNIENAVAAMAVAWLNQVSDDELRMGMASYSGVHRRFNIHVSNSRFTYIDDYAHHPTEIRTAILSARELYPNKTLTGIFQPHLYTRTRDFADEFAAVLSLLDKVILLPIYPARELPIEGVDSEMLLNKITITDKHLFTKEQLLDYIKTSEEGVYMTIGAGNIDRLVAPITEILQSRN